MGAVAVGAVVCGTGLREVVRILTRSRDSVDFEYKTASARGMGAGGGTAGLGVCSGSVGA
jgi:hypothetical protein